MQGLLFQPVTHLAMDLSIFGTSPLLSSEFLLGSTSSSKRILLILTSSHLLLCNDSTQNKVTHFRQLGFELKFEVLRLPYPDERTPGSPIGIKFELDSQSVEFYSLNREAVMAWSKQLESRLNQRNFHGLFKAKKKIGRGAFAAVYLAERLVDNQMVAVKAFSKEKQYSTDNGKESLQNEIRVMRQINHPNVIKLQAVFQTQNSIYVILQNLQGNQLHDFLRSNKKYDEAQITNIMRELLRGLSHLASKRIIHRDLKPQNIMFRKENSCQLVICDFGLSTHADAQKYLFVRCGTPGFVAPEIINIRDMETKGEPISDVFSAGLIFHFLLFGRSIFQGRQYNQLLAQNRACEFNFLDEKYSKMGLSAFDLLTRMLEKNPNCRISAEQALKHQFFQQKMELQQEDNVVMQKCPIIDAQNMKDNGDNNGSQCENFDHIAEIEVDGQIFKQKQQDEIEILKEQMTPSVFNSSNRALRKKTSTSTNNEKYSSSGKENCSPRLIKKISLHQNSSKGKQSIRKVI